jgi:hypothetical protein
MAIKTKIARDTYRSNVKERPLKQNGLEAQYQGLDITEVDIDHAGLAIIGRGGFQTRRDIRKVRKQYIVDVPKEEFNPTAELVFLNVSGGPFNHQNWGPTLSLQDLDGETFSLEDQDSNSFTFRFTNVETDINGEAIPASTDIAVNIFGNEFSKRDLMMAITGSIESVFAQGTFNFQLFSSGSKQDGEFVPEDKIVLLLSSSVPGTAQLTATSTHLGDSNNFGNQNETHEWRLNGFLKDQSNPRTFYEDLRTDTIMSSEPHYFRSSNMLFRSAQFDASDATEDLKNFYDKNINSIAGDPTSLDRFDTHDSSEFLVRQYPKREEIFDTDMDNFQWREDIHYLSPSQQTWTLMEGLALNYHSSLEAHIAAMMNSNFADEQYIESNPLSGRVDVFKRLSRIFDTHVDLIFERHPYSVFDQFLDPLDDFQNLQENRYPKWDILNSDLAFEDLKGARTPWFSDITDEQKSGENSMLFNDYFDQGALENHDFIEAERWTRIDEEMLDILTFNANRGTHIDRREWQETDYIYTATGFICSQTSGQDGIIYREMKR